jgi:hypothetical protein
MTLIAAVAFAAAVAATPASASLRIESFTTTATTGLAGAHPDVSTTFKFANKPGTAVVDGTLRDLLVSLPPGLIGDPHAVKPCARSLFAQSAIFGAATCPPASLVGVAHFTLQGFIPPPAEIDAAVYSLTAGPDEPAVLGIPLGTTNVYITIGSRTTSDFGLDTTIRNVPRSSPRR